MLDNLRRRPIASVVVAIQLLAALPLPAMAQSLPAFDALRTMTQQASVQQAVYALAAESADSDSDGYLEPPAMAAGAGPTGGGVIPSTSGAAKSDGYGVALGYCAWDNGSVASSSNRISGGLGLNRVSLAVITAGLDNLFQTSCTDLSAGTLRGDDYALWFTGTQLAQGVGGTVHWGAPASDVATLNGLGTSALVDGEVRLVKADNKLYRYTAGAGWSAVAGGTSSGDFTSSGTTLYYTAGQVGIGTSTPIAGSTLHVQGSGIPLYVQSTGQYSGMASLSAGGVQNGYVGFDNTGNQLLLNSIPAASQITLAVNGSTRVTVDASGNVNLVTGGLQVGGTAVLDASRNLNNIASITVAGGATISGTANVGALQIGGTTVIDGSRNVSNIGTLTAAGLITANNGLTINNGALTANAGIVTTNLNSGGQLAFTGNYGGSASAPALAFTGSSYTGGAGFFSPAGNQVAMATNGVERLRISSAGRLLLGTTTDDGSNLLQVNGGIAVGGATAIDASRNWAGNTIGVGYGGTGATTLAANGLLYGNGSSAVGMTSAGTGGQLLVANAAGVPTFVTLSGSGATASLSHAGVLTFSNIANGSLANSSVTLTAGTGLSGGGEVSLGGSVTLSLPNVGTASTYGSATQTPVFTTDAQGRISVVTNTTITPDWSNVASKPANVTALAGLTGANGALPYFTGAGAMAALAAGTSGYVLQANGAAAPSWVAPGTLAAGTATTAANLAGGALGALPYQSAAGTTALLTGNTSATRMFLAQTGTGAASTAPAWGALAAADIPNLDWSKLTSGKPTTLSGYGITDGVTLTGTEILTNKTLSTGSAWNGTAIGVAYGGTGLSAYAQGDVLYASAANTLAALPKGTAGQVLTMNAGATEPVWANVTATTATNLAGGALGSLPYQSAAGTTALLAGNTSATKMFLSQTGTGASSAAPAWGALVAADIPNLDWSKITTGKPTTLSGYGITDGVTLTGSQTLQNKILDNTNAITVKSTSLTLQDATTTTKQAQFVLAGITAGQTRLLTLPDYNGTLATLAGTETLTNKTLGAGSTWNGNAIGPTYGGTGLTAYAQGDLLYASAANTLARLAKGTANQVLTMDGTGTLPTWASAGAASVDWANPGTIGSTTPNTGAFTYVKVTGSTVPTNGMYLQAANSLGFSTNSAERVRITAAGILCVNCASGIPTGSNNPYYVTVNGNILGTRFDGSSDARLKTNVVTVSNALDKVRALRGVGFDWRTDIPEKNLPAGHDLGFIAQELEMVLPELVHTDGWGYRTVNYTGVIPVAIEAIKELDATVTRHQDIVKHFSKPDANTMVLDIAVLKAVNLLAEELGVKKVSTPVIEINDTFKITDKASRATRFEIDASGKVILDTLVIGRDVTVGGNSTITGTQMAGAFIPTSANPPIRGLFAPNARSLGFAADNKLMAELEARGFAVYGDIYVGEAGATKKVIDKDGFIYAANEVAAGNGCAGRIGAIGKDTEGNLYVCR